MHVARSVEYNLGLFIRIHEKSVSVSIYVRRRVWYVGDFTGVCLS